LLVNETLNANPGIAAARKRVPKAGLKYYVTLFMIQATGSPKVYIGRSMEAAHDHLNITKREWMAMTKHFRTVLNRFKVPKAEQAELFALVGSVKPGIVRQVPFSRL
jgi:hemoglobin